MPALLWRSAIQRPPSGSKRLFPIGTLPDSSNSLLYSVAYRCYWHICLSEQLQSAACGS